MGEVKIAGRQGNGFGEAHAGLGDKEKQPVGVDAALEIKHRDEFLQLVAAQVLFLLCGRCLALDDDLAGRIVGDQAVVNRVDDGTLELVVEIHGGLALMLRGVVVDELLVGYAVKGAELEARDKLLDPLLGQAVLLQCYLPDGAYLVDGKPV